MAEWFKALHLRFIFICSIERCLGSNPNLGKISSIFFLFLKSLYFYITPCLNDKLVISRRRICKVKQQSPETCSSHRYEAYLHINTAFPQIITRNLQAGYLSLFLVAHGVSRD